MKERFAARPGFATGVYATGINLGSAVAAALAVPIAHAFGGWRAALATFSVVTIALAGAWLWTVRGEPPHVRPTAPPRELPWRSPLAWRLVVTFALLSMTFYGMNSWLPATYVERGWSETSAGELVGLLNAVSVPGGLLMAALADRIPPQDPSPRHLRALRAAPGQALDRRAAARAREGQRTRPAATAG